MVPTPAPLGAWLLLQGQVLLAPTFGALRRGSVAARTAFGPRPLPIPSSGSLGDDLAFVMCCHGADERFAVPGARPRATRGRERFGHLRATIKVEPRRAAREGDAVARIGVALSGGGHRAALFGLGVLLYLADAKKNAEVVSIASVSGGSLTNGFVAQSLDYRATSGDAFREAARPLVRRLAKTGTFFPPSAFTWAYLALLLGSFLPLGGVWLLPWQRGWRLAAFAGALVAFVALTGARGLVCSRAFARTLYSPE